MLFWGAEALRALKAALIELPREMAEDEMRHSSVRFDKAPWWDGGMYSLWSQIAFVEEQRLADAAAGAPDGLIHWTGIQAMQTWNTAGL